MDTVKVSKTDYRRQKELLESYIGEEILYNGEEYKIENLFSGPIQIKGEDYSVNTTWNVCILSQNNEIVEISIDKLFGICYPHLCWMENENFSCKNSSNSY